MSNLAVIVFDDETRAYRASHALRELVREKKLARYADAIVSKTADGKQMVCRRLHTGNAGTWMTLLTGGLVGLLRGPIGVAFGAGTGFLVGALLDLIARAGIRKEFLAAASLHLPPGGAALVTEIDEGPQSSLDTRMQALGGEVWRRSETQVEGADGQMMSPGRM